MIAADILTDRDRVEFLEEEIIEILPVSIKQVAYVDRVNELLITSLAPQGIIRIQSPICLNNDSEAQPDLAILEKKS